MVSIGNSWDYLLKEEFKKPYYQKLRRFLLTEYSTGIVYPPMGDIFNALKSVSYEDAKVLILGQDPYHGEGQAHGYAFSVQEGIELPPSLRNIFTELYRQNSEFKQYADKKKLEGEKIAGDLTYWASQGVMLLNTVLTVRQGQAGSHSNCGWEKLTDQIIRILGHREKPMVFILWGNAAKSKKPFINKDKHLILEGVHPSPLSAHRGFFGGDYFNKANDFLQENGYERIRWVLE